MKKNELIVWLRVRGEEEFTEQRLGIANVMVHSGKLHLVSSNGRARFECPIVDVMYLSIHNNTEE